MLKSTSLLVLLLLCPMLVVLGSVEIGRGNYVSGWSSVLFALVSLADVFFATRGQK